MTVAEVTASPGNEEMAKFREFSFTSQRYQAFNLRKYELILYLVRDKCSLRNSTLPN